MNMGYREPRQTGVALAEAATECGATHKPGISVPFLYTKLFFIFI